MKLLLVGCGAMGSAMARGWLRKSSEKNIFRAFHIINPHKEKASQFLKNSVVKWFASSSDLSDSDDYDLIVFAVKPHILHEVLPYYKEYSGLIASIAASKPLDFYRDIFGKERPILRVMPNLPVAINQGVIGLLPILNIPDNYKKMAQTCFSVLGKLFWMQTDEQLDKMTLIAGSGPAYVFLLIESMAKAAESLGFSQEKSLQLAIDTVVGSSQYAGVSTLNPTQLREQVTSTKGITEAAMGVLMADHSGLIELMEKAIKAAEQRSWVMAR